MIVHRFYPISPKPDGCTQRGNERCIPCLPEPAKRGHVYRTRDGWYRYRVISIEEDVWRGTRAFAVMLNAAGFDVHDKAHFFGPHGEFCWPHNDSSPTDLVSEEGVG